MIKAVVFDLDETLIDSKGALIQYFTELYAHIGEPFPEANKEFLYTAPERGILKALIQNPDKLAAARAFRDSFSEERHLKAITLKPFAKETIEALHGTYKLAVATNRGPTTEAVLEQLGIRPYFEIVISARTLSQAKPHPLVMNTIFEHLNVTHAEAVFIGDSIVDVQTAKNVNVPSIIVGTHAKEGLGNYQLDDLSECVQLVERLSMS